MMDRMEKLREFLAANPKDNFVQHALALEHVKLGDDEQGRHLLENILANDPGYIGSYYHLAKLLERQGAREEAIKWYQQGMVQAKAAGDNHTYNELQAAYEDLVY
jgi:Tfp pilus assembly protein PilF